MQTQAAAVTAGGAQTIKRTGFVGGIEGGYDWRFGNLLVGVEADLQAVHLLGTASSGALPYPGRADDFLVTSYGDANWLLTARPRIGFITPNDWLLYVTGGPALTRLQTDVSFTDTFNAEETGRVDALKLGYAVGAGVEMPLSWRLSLRADYPHVAFSNTSGQSIYNNLLQFFPEQPFTHSGDLKADLFRLGLNYRFGGAEPESSYASASPPPMTSTPSIFRNWQLETGTRLWLSTGHEQEGPLIAIPPPTLNSRLTYQLDGSRARPSHARITAADSSSKVIWARADSPTAS
ncbi:MAG TPA: outer membrane beta-barrel protein [Xanthobacteraceae bacterium]